MDRLKKCYVTDPETNLGVPVELTAADVRPYFEHQHLLGRLPAFEFAPHVFDKEQELPLSLLPDQLRDEMPNTPRGLDNESSLPKRASSPPSEPAPEAPDITPAPVEVLADSTTIEAPAPEPEPHTSKRGRGRPSGSKNKPKVCQNCTPSEACIAHCTNCKGGLACNLHTASQRCAKCTRTRLCAEHTQT